MTYLMTTKGTGDEATFRKVSEKVLPNADGLIAIYAGATDTGMAVTTVWHSKAQADRFTAEVLIPAIVEVHGAAPSSPPSTVIEFEAFFEHATVPA